MQMKRLLDRMRKKVTPTPREDRGIRDVIKRSVEVTKHVIKPLGLDFTLAGSFIRDTWMPDKKEFEIFLLFPEKTSRKDLEKKGLETGKKIVRKMGGIYIVAYAEHPYVRASIEGYDVDIVPCYKLESATSIRSAVDRTPFHNQWIGKNLTAGMSTEVRLFKRFTKTLGIYGSDTRVQGFSGYLCELLIVKYGSFENMVREAAKWEPGKVFIDLEGHHGGKPPARLMKIRFRNQPLIVIDPVDPNRNVAAAFTPENFARFTIACEQFIRKPSERFFFPKPEKVEAAKIRSMIKERGSLFLVLSMERPDVIDDTLWPQLRRTASRISDMLRDNDFMVIDWDVHSDEGGIKGKKGQSFILLEMGVWKLPAVRKVTGPPVFIRDRVAEFRKKYGKSGRVWVEGDRVVAEVKREHLDARKKLEDELGESLKKLKSKGIASHVAKSINRDGFRIMENSEIARLAGKDRGFGLFLKHYLEKGV